MSDEFEYVYNSSMAGELVVDAYRRLEAERDYDRATIRQLLKDCETIKAELADSKNALETLTMVARLELDNAKSEIVMLRERLRRVVSSAQGCEIDTAMEGKS